MRSLIAIRSVSPPLVSMMTVIRLAKRRSKKARNPAIAAED
jgi:hypothetical protein